METRHHLYADARCVDVGTRPGPIDAGRAVLEAARAEERIEAPVVAVERPFVTAGVVVVEGHPGIPGTRERVSQGQVGEVREVVEIQRPGEGRPGRAELEGRLELVVEMPVFRIAVQPEARRSQLSARDRLADRGIVGGVLVESEDVQLGRVAPGKHVFHQQACELVVGVVAVEPHLVVAQAGRVLGQALDGQRVEDAKLAPLQSAPAPVEPGEGVAGVSEAVARHEPPAADVHGEAPDLYVVAAAQGPVERELGVGPQQLGGVDETRVDGRVRIFQVRTGVLELPP
jgi:hypothetical protein